MVEVGAQGHIANEGLSQDSHADGLAPEATGRMPVQGFRGGERSSWRAGTMSCSSLSPRALTP